MEVDDIVMKDPNTTVSETAHPRVKGRNYHKEAKRVDRGTGGTEEHN